MKRVFDVVIIGGGVIGCSLSRTLSLNGLKVAVMEKANDVGEGGASKSNSAIAHTGFDAEPNSLESKLVTQASKLWPKMADYLKIPYRQVGALMIATSREEFEKLKKFEAKSHQNQVFDVHIVNRERVRELEPNAFSGKPIYGGLHIPRESIIDPFATSFAYAEIAKNQGNVEFLMQDYPIKITTSKTSASLRADGNLTLIESKQNRKLYTKILVNCAGLGVKQVSELYGGDSYFTLNPRRGQFLIFEKAVSTLTSHILLPIPHPIKGKGILVCPTIWGNTLCGPTSEDLSLNDNNTTSTTREGIDLIKSHVYDTLPLLKTFTPIGSYAGSRSNCKEGSYLIRYNDGNNPGIVTVAGVRSTGMSASFTLADEIALGLEKHCGAASLLRNSAMKSFNLTEIGGGTSYPIWYERNGLLGQSEEKKATNTNDKIVCFCENVTENNIRDAIKKTLALEKNNTDFVKRHTRATAGKCQGFNCLVNVCNIVSEETKTPFHLVNKTGNGSEWFPTFEFSSAARRFGVMNEGKQQSSSTSSSAVRDFVVIGGGPAGLGFVAGLKDRGKKSITIIERNQELGGIPNRYAEEGKKTFVDFENFQLVNGKRLIQRIIQENSIHNIAEVRTNTLVVSISKPLGDTYWNVQCNNDVAYRAKHLVLATGCRESTATERGNVFGARQASTIFTNHLLSLREREGGKKLIFNGSNLISRSLSKKQSNALFINGDLDESPLVAQMVFGGSNAISVREILTMENNQIQVNGGTNQSSLFENAKLILAGNLTSNNELFRTVTNFENLCVIGNAKLRVKNQRTAWPGHLCYLRAKYYESKML